MNVAESWMSEYIEVTVGKCSGQPRRWLMASQDSIILMCKPVIITVEWGIDNGEGINTPFTSMKSSLFLPKSYQKITVNEHVSGNSLLDASACHIDHKRSMIAKLEHTTSRPCSEHS